jgi:phosphatidylserine synthase
MLQRIQSIYLLLAGLALFALFLFPLVHNIYVDGKPITLMVTGVYQDVNGQNTHTEFFAGLTIATAIIAIIPLVIIFLYKNRKQQIALSYSALLVIVGYSFWLSQAAKKVMGSIQIDTHNWGIGLFLSSISMLLVLLAIRAIKADEKLVKSADRLR